MSLILITTRNHQQKAFWEHRLQQSFPDMQFAVLVEDWPGGAGNGLGTLYAFQQAFEAFNEDLFELLKKGTSIALYHCAGEGQRLYPISASEHNNKAALKLPGVITCEKKETPITLLEAILKQTESFVSANPGRLSVFWGDQLFFPTAKPNHHVHAGVDIYVKPIKFPTKHEWESQHLDRYGIVLLGMEGQGTLLEKPHYEEITHLVVHGAVNTAKGVNLSLGSFSMSPELLKGLTTKFEHELSQKKGKLDTDPHFWMPLTLSLELYVKLMTAKGDNPSHVEKHWHKMQDLKTQNTLGIIDLGADCSWWDFGSIQIYVNNLLKMLDSSEESQRIRKFLHMPSSGILNSHIKKSKIVNSIVVDTEADELNVQNSVIIGTHLEKLQCKNCLYYNVHEKGEIKGSEGIVRSDVSGKTYTAPIQSDPKKNWNVVLPGNPMSWKDLHQHIEHRP